jgi:hydrogenase nickel incorporation protein HypA/HybF
MHELGIVFNIMDSLESVAKENDLTAIQSVTVEVGEVSTVIPDYLTDCWNWARKKKELLQGCEMVVETIHAVTHCDGCGEDYPTVAHGRICPNCGSEKTWLITGNEINIKEITVSDETEEEQQTS